MKRVVARAPGKLFLLGEYAVLDGCPAVVAAIDRYIEVNLDLRVTRATTRVRAAGYGEVEFAADRPPAIHGPLRFAIAALRSALSRCPELSQRGFAIDIASRSAEAVPAQLGLGSSAAVTVAVVAALLASGGESVPQSRVFAAALEAHRAAQDGIGSGADVAASVYGGLVLFQPQGELLPLVAPLALPPQATLLAAWSGESAATEGLAKRYLAARNGAAAMRAAFVDASQACVDRFVGDLARGALALSAVDSAGDVLERLANQLGLPVLTPRLRQLVAIAREHGAGAKTSGAGNGDCGIALTQDRAVSERIRTAWHAAGLMPLDIHVSPHGVTVGLS